MSLQFQKAPENVLFDLSTKMNILKCKFSDLLKELNTTRDQIEDIFKDKSKLDLISVENGNPILNYNMGVCFQNNVRSDVDNRMNIEYDPTQSAVYIHTLSSHIRISNDFRVILLNDEIHFIKPGVDITNYAEHAILKWGSNSEESVSTSNVTYINADNVQTDLETYLKNIDTKLSAIPTLPILATDVRI
jgi:hypothetical protein